MYRNNPQHTGVTTDVVVPPLKLKWKQTFGGHMDSSPAVFGSRVYVGSDDNKLYCINATTGNVIWSFNDAGFAAAWDSSPFIEVVGGQTVIFVGNGNNWFYAIRDDGTAPFKLWMFNSGGAVVSSPVVMTVSGTEIVIFGNNAIGLYALVASTGTLYPGWATNPFTDGGLAGTFISSPAVLGSTIFVGNTNGKLYAINAGNGALLWSIPTGSSIQSSPAVANVVVAGVPTDLVFVGADDGKLRARVAASGVEKWTFSAAGAINSSPAIATIPSPPVACAPGPILAVIFGSQDDNVYAVRASDGTFCWTFPSNGPDNFDSSPTISGQTVYIGSDDRSFYAININTGVWLWSFPALAAVGDPDTTPNAAISGSTVYFGTKAVAPGGGSLYAFEPMTVTASTTQTVTVSTTTTTASTAVTHTSTNTTYTTLTSSIWTTTVMPPSPVPGFPVESIIVGLIGGLFGLSLLRRRRRA
jgi:outer membrane protein assembly factor BamB